MSKLVLSIALLLIAGGIAFLIFRPSAQDGSGAVNGAPPVTLPSSDRVPAPAVDTSDGLGTVPSAPAVTFEIMDSAGKPIRVREFLKDETVLLDKANPGTYLIAGNLGSCVNDPAKCQAGPEVPFNIYYEAGPQAFTIALITEPLGVNRAEAERALQDRLGIPRGDMCRLNYYVSTSVYVNEQYAGKNLGFSFCPGATILP